MTRTGLLLPALCCLMFAGTAQCAELKPWKSGATPSLILKDPAGRSHALSAYRGKVVLLNFWATWCEPCREEMPSMQTLRTRLSGKPFEVLTVNLMESEERIAAFLNADLIDLPVLMDRDGAVAKSWKVRMLPRSFLIDRQGLIRYELVGEADWTGPAVASIIERLITSDETGKRTRAQ